jgi:hypothetical protein
MVMNPNDQFKLMDFWLLKIKNTKDNYYLEIVIVDDNQR